MNIVFDIFLLHGLQNINLSMCLHNIWYCHQHKFEMDRVLRIVLINDQHNKSRDNLMINQHFCICKFGLDCIHNCHLGITQHKCLSLSMCLRNKITLCHCNDQHMLMSIYQRTLVTYIVDCISFSIKYQQNIHQDKVVHMCKSTCHPIITSQMDIVPHMSESYCQQSKGYLHIDKHTCSYLDQHT